MSKDAEHSAQSIYSPDGPSAFERDTIHRLATEAVRYWLVTTYLASGSLPNRGEWFVYASGAHVALDWANSPGPDDPSVRPLRGKRIRVTFEIEDWQP